MAAAGASGVGAGVAGGGPADGASEKRYIRCDNRQWFEPALVCTHGTHILLENFW